MRSSARRADENVRTPGHIFKVTKPWENRTVKRQRPHPGGFAKRSLYGPLVWAKPPCPPWTQRTAKAPASLAFRMLTAWTRTFRLRKMRRGFGRTRACPLTLGVFERLPTIGFMYQGQGKVGRTLPKTVERRDDLRRAIAPRPVAQMNEIFYKILCQTYAASSRALSELGIEAKFWDAA